MSICRFCKVSFVNGKCPKCGAVDRFKNTIEGEEEDKLDEQKKSLEIAKDVKPKRNRKVW